MTEKKVTNKIKKLIKIFKDFENLSVEERPQKKNPNESD